MRVPRFYLPVPLTVGAHASLEGGAFNHAVRVLRLKPGAPLILFDGEGGAYTATLGEISGREASVEVMEALPAPVEPALPIVLAQGISRGEKMDHTVQKAVELGVSIFQPLFTERGGVRLNDERLTRKVQHWRGIVIGACEQCGRNRLPELREPLTLATWLAMPMAPGSRLLLDPLAEHSLRSLDPPSEALTLLIGPEGGLSPEELAQARTAGFVGVRLGPRVLRTETAGMAALAAVQALWGDWD